MSQKTLWQLEVTAESRAEEPLEALVSSLFDRAAACYVDISRDLAMVSQYCSSRKEWDANRQRKLRQGLNQLQACGALKKATVRFRAVRNEDWAESWKRHFRPLKIGNQVLVLPSWKRCRPEPGQAVVILDPGLSFGTGHHATTRYCLRQVAARRKAGGQTFLDLGTGSGILALAAAKLGYQKIEALDFDAQAVAVARANAWINKVANRINISQKDVSRLPVNPREKFDLVCANLISDLLITERKRIGNRVKPGGFLVLAGILAGEFERVRAAYEHNAFRPVGARTEREWRSGIFQKIFE